MIIKVDKEGKEMIMNLIDLALKQNGIQAFTEVQRLLVNMKESENSKE